MHNEICVIRMGGLGDLAILSSSLRALKAKVPWRPLVLATLSHNVDLLSGADYLDRVITVDDHDKEKWFKIFDCRWGVEPPTIGPGKLSWEDYIGRDRSDNFDRLLGVQNMMPKDFSVQVEPGAMATMSSQFSHKAKGPFIGIAPTSRSPVRCMPPEYVSPLVEMIIQARLGTPVLFGKTESWSESLASLDLPGTINFIDRLNLKKMVALISLLDMVISPDTGIYHVAAALHKPCLALFGNIEPHTRTTYYPTVRSLYPAGELHCIPCWDVPGACTIVPGVFGSPCMHLLTPERIMEGMKEIMP